MTKLQWLGIALAIVLVLAVAALCVNRWWITPGVIRELRENPQGEQARKVMVLTLPSGRPVTINYLREGQTVYAAADFPWWRELRGGGGRGSCLIRGEELHGYIRAIEDDPKRRAAVFARLRPT